MDETNFWSIIESTHQQSGEDYELQRRLLIEALSVLTTEDIQEFDRLLWLMMAQAYRTDIWEAAWLIECGCGDDAFHDFRNWLIAQGETVYNKVLEDPENLSDIVTKENRFDGLWASIVYTASEAYERKTGQKIPQTGYRQKPVLVGGDLSPESEIAKRFPRIVAKIGGCDEESLFD